MEEEHIVVPTKEQVVELLEIAIANQNMGHMKTMGELLGLKWVDSLMPKMPIEPDWDYYGLRKFCDDNGIGDTDTFAQALQKLK